MKAKLVRIGSVLVVLLVMALFVAPKPVYAATYFSRGTGNWNTAATWSTAACGGAAAAAFPVAGDTVTICNTHTVTVNVSSAAASVNVAAGSTLAVGFGNTLTVSGDFSGSGTLTGGTTARAYFVGGNWTFNGTSAASVSLTLNGTGNQTLSGVISTATANTPNLTINKASGSVILGSAITLGATSTFILTAGTFDPSTFLLTAVTPTFTAGTLRVGATTWGGNYSFAVAEPAAGTIEYYASGAQTVNNVNTYGGDLVLSGSGVKTLGAAMTTIGGDLTLSGSATATTAAAMTIGGNLNVGAGTIFATGATNTWTLSVTGTTSVSGTLTLANTGTKTFTGNVTVNGSGIWNETGIAAINFAGNLQNDGTFTASTGTHTFTGAAKTFSGANAISIPNTAITGSYTNNGTLTVGTALTGAGSLTQGTNATLNIGATAANLTLTTLTATASGNTVNYNLAGAQTVKATPYVNLTLSGSGAKTLGGNTTVNGTLSMQGTATFANGGFTLTYGAAAALEYRGSAAQTTGPEFPATWAGTGGVIINNANGVTLGASRTISGTSALTLALTSGNLTAGTGTNQLTLGCSNTTVSSAGGGDVIGDVVRNCFVLNNTYAFNNPNTSLTFVTTSTLPSAVTLNLNKVKPPEITTAITRTYTITPTNSTSYSATLSLRYANSEKGGMREDYLRLWRSNGTRYTLQGGTDTTDLTNPYVSLIGVTAFSPWAITDDGTGIPPTAVTLSALNTGSDAAPNNFIIPVLGFTGGLAVIGGAWLAFLARRGKRVFPGGNKPAAGQ